MSENKIQKIEKSVAKIEKSVDRLLFLIDGDKNMDNGITSVLTNHERRINGLEHWQIRVIAIYSAALIVFSFLSPIIYDWIKGLNN